MEFIDFIEIIGGVLLIIGALWLLTHGHIARGIAVLTCVAIPILLTIMTGGDSE